ncbi:hypothetical protein [Vibrio campbellii]|uniref:DUF596 domain-containing protein n=1 Tax=Vibrio campbellii TaxID=680 RepID=A0ABY5IJI0_9VIBR|nr:hypothetical protein [Vibrio campbellii]UTZ24201.1 hypothetical protein HB760_20920 [Vibrio campbellii]UTZ33660.1 hypothetical protein HB762_20525 [Vibrio campbellii]
MNLKYPDSDFKFEPGPDDLIFRFDIYDREDTLGEYLSSFDPNDPEQLCTLLEERFFEFITKPDYSSEHQWVLMEMLKDALNDKDYDFSPFLCNNDDECFYLPWTWDIRSPRRFFEIAYQQMYKNWAGQLVEEGFEVTKPEEIF